MKRFVPLLFVTFICGVFIMVGFFMVKKGHESESWPTATGIIKSNKVVEETSHSSHTSGKSRSTKITWSVKLDYDYNVKNKTYTGQRISYKGVAASKEGAYEVSAKYPLNQIVKVYYNPEKPGEAVLITGYDFFNLLFLIIPSIFLLIWFIVLSPFKFRKQVR